VKRGSGEDIWGGWGWERGGAFISHLRCQRGIVKIKVPVPRRGKEGRRLGGVRKRLGGRNVEVKRGKKPAHRKEQQRKGIRAHIIHQESLSSRQEIRRGEVYRGKR